MKEQAMHNNSQVKFKKTEVEDHHRISSISNKSKSVTACNNSLKSITSNVNVVCATCGKCVFNSNHDACVSKFLNDVNVRSKKPQEIMQLILFIIDSRCTKHMTSNLKLLCNFIEKYVGTVHFRNDQFAPILGYRDLVQGNITIKRGNDLLIGNRRSDLYTISLQDTTSPTQICFMAKASPTQAWLWHRRLSHLNFDTINLLSKKDIVIGLPKLKYVKDQLCSYCELGKEKRSTFKTKTVSSSKGRLNLLHMELCGPMRIESINGKKYILVIVDDYSRYTWTHFLRTKDKTPEVLKDFLKIIQRNLQAQVNIVRTDRGIELLNKTLHAYFKEEGIKHKTSTPQTRKQNDVQLHVILRTDLSSSPNMKRHRITSSMAENLLLNTFTSLVALTSDHNSLKLKIQDHSNEPSSSKLVLNVSPPAATIALSLQELDFLFIPLFEEYFTVGNQSVPKSSSLTDNSSQPDT
ncbi:retrovirus-related pol polyprotein from transposon TNT 1-94 [Tanacetum coccineum]